jgi:hypothetical protein
MEALLKLINTFKTILIKIPADFYAEIYKPILKLILKHKGNRIAKTILKKERN